MMLLLLLLLLLLLYFGFSNMAGGGDAAASAIGDAGGCGADPRMLFSDCAFHVASRPKSSLDAKRVLVDCNQPLVL